MDRVAQVSLLYFVLFGIGIGIGIGFIPSLSGSYGGWVGINLFRERKEKEKMQRARKGTARHGQGGRRRINLGFFFWEKENDGSWGRGERELWMME